MVTWSGTSPAQITLNAMSVRHSASIRRELVTRCAYAHTSSAVSMSGSYPAAPGPPARRVACTAAVSRCRSTAVITSHTG
jgi:hypothetical protein